jgi:hypothetical protein
MLQCKSPFLALSGQSSRARVCRLLVESRRGAVAWAIWRRSVSSPRSSNRTCRFPAFGFPTGFTVRHTGSNQPHAAWARRVTLLRSSTQQSRTTPVFDGVFRLIANHHDLAIFESAPEVRALCSAGITRLQRSYDPVRIPSWPPPFRDVEAATLTRDGPPPITRTTFPTCRAHYPGGSSGCACRLLPHSCSLPLLVGGSASALSLSRPAQASLTLRPARSLSRPRRPLSRGSGPAGYPAEPLVSYQINRQFSGWNPPPLMIRAFGAHD